MTVHHSSGKKAPALSAHCRFDDHIRCVAAKKNLTHKREALRLAKMTTIAEMLDLPLGNDQAISKRLLKYQGVSVVGKNSSRPGSHGPKPSLDHVTSCDADEQQEVKQLTAAKNDDGSLVLPFNKEVEMSELVFPLTPQDSQQFDLLIDSSFSHEDQHLDQAQLQSHSNQALDQIHFDKQLDQPLITEQPH